MHASTTSSFSSSFSSSSSSSSSSSRWRIPRLKRSLNQRALRSISLKASSSSSSSSSSFDDGGGCDKKGDDFESFLFEWQKELCEELTRLDGSNNIAERNHEGFCDDAWEREDGSFGRTRVFTDGDLFEKAACNVSVIRGTLTETRAKTMSSRGRKGINPKGGQKYNACALSLVWHPRSPHVPTFRADIRRFAVEPDSSSRGTETNAWYGGGMDLTPYYLDEEDAKHFHRKCRDICDEYQTKESVEKFGEHSLYRKYKEFCDEYFYIPARLEHRGVGGLFFDDVATTAEKDDVNASVAPSDAKAFTKAVALSWLDIWEPIATRKRNIPITEKESIWHQQRRGRYLEFNLLYDRGVKFGLDGVTPDRFESIMVSAPPRIRWDYKATPPEGSKEARLLEVLRKPVDWVD